MCILWMVGAILYTLITVRVSVVLRRVETRIGRNSGVYITLIAAVFWPVLTVAVGAMTLLADDVGIFAPNYKWTDDVDGAVG